MKLKYLSVISIIICIVFICTYYILYDNGNKYVDQIISNNTNNNLSKTASKIIYGTVYVQILTLDVIPEPVIDAKVTLFKYGFNNITGMYQILNKINIPDNPLTHTNVVTDTPAYSFDNVQKNTADDSWGYEVAIEKDGYMLEMPVIFNQQSGVYYNKDNWAVIPQGLTNNTIYGYVNQHDFNLDKNVPVPNSKITLLHYNNLTDNTNMGLLNDSDNVIGTIESGIDGFFRFDNITSGYYELIAEKSGLKDYYRIYFYGNEVSIYQINYLNLH